MPLICAALLCAACGGRAVESLGQPQSNGAGGMADTERSGCVASASLGSTSMCALRTDGVVFCWGNNGNGQAGNPEETPSPIHRVDGFDAPVIQIVANGQTSFALTEKGEVWAWGSDRFGSLGDGGAAIASIFPVKTAPIPGTVTHLSAQGTHACALTDAGSVYCWGNGAWGELGPRENGAALEDAHVPVRMKLAPMAFVAAAGVHTCVADTVSTWCWGGRRAEPFGEGPTWPVLVNWGGEVAWLEASSRQTCVISTRGAVVCWNVSLQANEDPRVLGKAAPVDRIALPEPAVELSASGTHTCALSGSGLAHCWGDYDGYGALGRVERGDPKVPEPVDVLPGPLRHTYAGDDYSCAIDERAELWCWGANSFGTIEYIEESSYKEPPRLEPVKMAIPCP